MRRPRFGRLAGQPDGPHQLLDALMGAVLRAPADDAPRLVLADWLTEHGDPRGQFIALQVRAARGSLTPGESERMGALERRHRAAWLGPVARVMTKLVFERGFLDGATLAPNAVAGAETWEAAFVHPSLETLRWLELGRGNRKHYLGFLRGGRLLCLDVSCVPTQVKGALAPRRPRAQNPCSFPPPR